MIITFTIYDLNRPYKIRPYKRGDEEKIDSLLNLVFKGWPKIDLDCNSIEHWRWKYEDSTEKSYIVVTEIDENIIGCHHGMTFKLKFGDKVFKCHYGADMATHPSYRRRGISNKQIEFLNTLRRMGGVDVVLMIANPNTLDNLSRKFPRLPFTVLNLVKIKDIEKQLDNFPVHHSWLIRIGFNLQKILWNIINLLNRQEKVPPQLEIRGVGVFNNRIDSFCREVVNNYDFIIVRHREYLNWRYCDHRAGNYIARQAEENEDVVGYSILSINKYKMDYPIGYIVDLHALPGREEVVDALVADATSFFENNDVNIINCQVIKGHPYVKILERRGFFNSRIKIHLFYSSLEQKEILKTIEKIPASKAYLSWGDHDSLPVDIPRY